MQQITPHLLYRLRKGFSLIELLLVILIVSIIYYLGFSGFEKLTPKKPPLTILNLKQSITPQGWFQGHKSFMCTKGCSKCYIRSGTEGSFTTYQSKIDLHDIVVYTLTKDNNLEPITYGRFNDEKICLVIDFYNNGASTPLVVEQNESFYFLPSYFGEAKKFESLEEAEEFWEAKTQVATDAGDYYR